MEMAVEETDNKDMNDLSGRRASNQNTTTPSTSAAQSSNAATRHTHTTSTARATVDPDALKYMPAVPYKGPMKIPGHDPAGDDRITNYRNTITAGEGDVTAGYDANDSVTRHRGDNTADSARGLEIAVTIEAHVGDDNFDASTQVPVGILAGENSEAASFHQATVADGVPNVEGKTASFNPDRVFLRSTAGVSAGEDNAVKYSM
ncbi:hypothetical protein BDQ17DRAFT_1544524 [Cyathus striatus]|nr:hypothetical protein BDQ17DRAFT_1544524 [Cyathus striatus]